MHGVLRLIQNEISKIFHQMSWKILTLLLLLLSIGTPILSYVTGAVHDPNSHYANAEKNAEKCEEGSIEKEYYLTLAQGYNYFADQGFKEGVWQYENYFYEYIETVESIKGCQLFLDGKDILKILDYFNIEDVRDNWIIFNDEESHIIVYEGHFIEKNVEEDNEETLPAETTAPDTTAHKPEFAYAEGTAPFTTEIAQKILTECEERLEIIKGKLKQSFEEFAEDQIADYQPDYQKAKEDYENAKAVYEKDKSTIREYTAAKLVKEGYDILFDTLNRMELKNVSKDIQSSFADNISYTAMEIQKGADLSPISEKDYETYNYVLYFMGSDYDNYSDYIRAVEQRQNQYYKAIKKYAYCLEHSIAVNDYLVPSRRMVEDCLHVNLTVIMLMGIFMSAVIVASEHTSGAIRLLMIRPRARWKILLSKLCCVLIFTLGWTVATSILSTVVNGILFGWEDLAVPYVMVGDEAYEVAPLIYLIQIMTVSYLPAFSMICLAFLMSTLIKRAVVSMAIPMVINIFGGPASTLFIGKACKVFPPLKFTPIPYFNLSSFWGEPIAQLESYGSPLDHGLTLNMGILMFVIYSLLLLVLSFIVFKKQQIKN